MRMLISVFFTIVFQIVFCAYTIANISDKDYINHEKDDDEKMVGLMKIDSLVALNWATIALSICLILLDFYLLTFHFYLIRKNLSTYKHIRRKLKKKNSSIIREVKNNNQTSEKSEKRVADARDAADEEESKNANSILSQSADDILKKTKQVSRRVTYK